MEDRRTGVGPAERTPIRTGRTKTGGLLEALIGVGILLVVISFFA